MAGGGDSLGLSRDRSCGPARYAITGYSGTAKLRTIGPRKGHLPDHDCGNYCSTNRRRGAHLGERGAFSKHARSIAL